MSQVRQTKLYFDITQLFLRVALSTPSGIGRVELAYAKHLMSRYPDKVRFIFALPNMIQVLPTQEVARYITAMENLWCDEDDESFKTASRVDALVIPPFLTGFAGRIYAANFSFCAGVMPPIPMLGRSLL